MLNYVFLRISIKEKLIQRNDKSYRYGRNVGMSPWYVALQSKSFNQGAVLNALKKHFLIKDVELQFAD